MGYVNKIQIGENAAHLIEPTLYGTCSTAAATAIKDVTLDSFTLTPGVQIAVKFTVTNTAAASDLKLRVNSTNADDAKPIKYRGANLSDKGTLANKRVYLFLYDGTNWELVGDIDTTNSNTLQRTFRSSSDVELPIAGINSSNSATATYNTSSSISSGSYASMYAAIPNTVANLATINPSTGKITVPGGVVADVTGNASTATNVALSGVTDAENLQAIEALTGTEGFLKKTAANTWSLDTTNYITKLNSSTDNAIVRFDGTSGAIQDSGVMINDNDHLIAPSIRIANTYYGISFGRTTGTPVETILHTGIKWVSGSHMPVIHITGYAYGLHSPVEFKIGFYIYGDKIGYCGATNMGSWEPDIYLFKEARDGTNYVAVGLAGSCYFLQLSVDLQDEMGKFNNVVSTDWSWDFLTTTGTIPSVDDGTTCVKVPYKASIFGAKYAKITTTSNAIAYYIDTIGTFGSRASANGALYATSANGALQWGTLPIAQGGTGATSAANARTNLELGTMATETASLYAKLASPALTGTPTAPTAADGTNTTQIATTAFVMSQFKYNDAMIYKGVVNANADLPATHYQGWTYKVGTAGTYAGVACEIGDMIICNTDGTSANNAHWNVIQTNIDGAVIGPAAVSSGRDNKIVRFDGETGKLIQDSKITIDDNGNLLISHAASATMTADSTNPKITFAESGTQPVHLIYSDYDSYRSPAGLKIIGGTSATPAWLEVEGNVYAAAFKGNADTATSATTATSLTNFVVSTYTIAAGKGVRIKYPSSAPVLISCQRNTGGSRLILIGGGYGEEGTVRNDFTELVSPAESHFTWSMPQTTGYACTIEIMHHDTSGTATVWVETTAACTFTEIAALTSTKTNRKLLHSSNYTDYTVTKTGSGASGSWEISITGSSTSCTGNAATATTATNLSAAPTITQAGSSGTTLSAATFYTLTVGGQTVVFKTPADTNDKVTQNVKTDNKKYGIILSNYETSASTTTTAAVNRDSKVYVNPSLNSVNAGQFVLHDKAATPVEKAYMIWNATDQSIDFVFN